MADNQFPTNPANQETAYPYQPPTAPQAAPVQQQDAAASAQPINEKPVRPVTLGAGIGGTAPVGSYPASAAIEQPAEDDAAFTAYKTLEARRRRKRRNRVIAGVVAAGLALGALGWFAGTRLMAPDGATDGPAYDLGVATIDDFETSVSASGSIQPASQVVVTPEVEGIIQDVRVAEGDTVRKGDILFSLRNNALDKAVQDAEQAVKSAENGVVQAQNALATANNALANAQSNYNKVFSTGFETQEEADAAGQEATDTLIAAENAVDSARLALEDAQIAVTNAQDALQLARDNADKRTVVAPETGTIIAMNVETGASAGGTGSASGGSSSSLVTIADLTSLRVRVQVNEVDINNLTEGQTAEVTFSALPDIALLATVERIAATSGQSEEGYGSGIVTYDVDLVIPSPDPQVKPGMTARVKILTKKIEGGMTIPAAAITYTDDMQTQGTIQVATYSGQSVEPTFEERQVRVLATDGATAVVEGDLIEGEEVQLYYGAEDDDSAWAVSVG